MRIYFIRHTQTEYNIRQAYYGALNAPINADGRRQAKALGALLSEAVWDEIWMSDLLRVEQTVQLVLEQSRQDSSAVLVKTFEAFREMDFGQWEGLDYKTVQTCFHDDFERWSKDWKYAAPTGGETYAHFFERVFAQFTALTETIKNREGTLLIAAHNGTLRIMFALMLGLGMDGTWHFNFEQDAYSVVDFEYDNFTIRSINSREKVKKVCM